MAAFGFGQSRLIDGQYPRCTTPVSEALDLSTARGSSPAAFRETAAAARQRAQTEKRFASGLVCSLPRARLFRSLERPFVRPVDEIFDERVLSR